MTPQALDRAIGLASGYLDGLYKPLPGGGAVQSEAYGLPLRLYLPGYHRWVLVGQGHSGECLRGTPCSAPTTLTPLASSRTTESYRVTFDTPTRPRAVQAIVAVNWATGRRRFAVTVTGLASADARTGAQLWLDDVALTDTPSPARAAGAPPAPAPATTRTFPVSRRTLLATLRYTVRHATQEAYLRATITGRTGRAQALATFLTANGYRPGVDIRAALFGRAAGLGDGFAFTSGAYPDCQHLPAPGTTAYPYTSKVCLVGVPAFLLSGRGDPFLQESVALQVLGTSGNPSRRYPLLVRAGMGAATPAQTATALERAWAMRGYGIAACTPASCETARVSGLRTFQFGALETLLGYRYGDATSRRFADAAAARALAVQIGVNGLIRSREGDVVRPAQAGAFPIFWDAAGRFAPTTGAAAAGSERLSMPDEYIGVSVSDSETTFDAWAFLTLYRCARYRVGCASAPYGPLFD
jgi:hypothetical protein